MASCCQRPTKGFIPEETVTRTERSFERKNRNSSLTGHTNGVAPFSADSFDEAFLNLAELIIAKQRNGPTGDVPLVLLREFTRFESRAKNRAV